MLAEEFRELQAYGQRKLAEKGYTTEDVPRLVRRAIKGDGGSGLPARSRALESGIGETDGG